MVSSRRNITLSRNIGVLKRKKLSKLENYVRLYRRIKQNIVSFTLFIDNIASTTSIIDYAPRNFCGLIKICFFFN